MKSQWKKTLDLRKYNFTLSSIILNVCIEQSNKLLCRTEFCFKLLRILIKLKLKRNGNILHILRNLYDGHLFMYIICYNKYDVEHSL